MFVNLFKFKTDRLRVKRGFTLVESLIYLAIIAAVAVVWIRFSLSLNATRAKVAAEQLVQANARLVMNILTENLRAAAQVDLPESIFGTDPGRLSLITENLAANPTIFALSQDDGQLTMTSGLAPSQQVTDDQVRVTRLVFTDLTGNSSRQHIRVDLTVEYAATNDVAYAYQTSLQTAVSLRQ